MSPVQQLPLDEAVALLREAADTPPLTMREALCRVWKAATASHSLLEAHGRVFSILARLVRAIAASMVVLLDSLSPLGNIYPGHIDFSFLLPCSTHALVVDVPAYTLPIYSGEVR